MFIEPSAAGTHVGDPPVAQRDDLLKSVASLLPVALQLMAKVTFCDQLWSSLSKAAEIALRAAS